MAVPAATQTLSCASAQLLPMRLGFGRGIASVCAGSDFSWGQNLRHTPTQAERQCPGAEVLLPLALHPALYLVSSPGSGLGLRG